jgi:hypothetical protein
VLHILAGMFAQPILISLSMFVWLFDRDPGRRERVMAAAPVAAGPRHPHSGAPAGRGRDVPVHRQVGRHQARRGLT